MKKYFFLLTVCSLLLSACGGATPPQTEPKSSVGKSLKDLLSSGMAQRCTWQVNTEGQQMTGTVLVRGQKFKQIITMPSDTGNITTTAISDGTYYYSWSEPSNGMGMKINIEQSQQNAPSPGEINQGSVDWGQQYNYDCSPAVVSEADFAIPNNINFTDFSEIQKSLEKLDLDKLQQQFGQQ